MLSLLAVLSVFIVKLLACLLLVLTAVILSLKYYYEPSKGKCRCSTDLTGKVALITGGSSGIGLETARELAKRGAKVIIASRNAEKGTQAVYDLRSTTNNILIRYEHLDLSKFSSIKQFAEDFNRDNPRLDILVNNAGCAGVPKKISADGVELVMQINYLGPFLLTNLLLDKLKESQPSRIVIVSSKAHEYAVFNPEELETNNIDSYWTRYANTKLCNILWNKALAQRLPKGVTVNALHPGLVMTNIFDKMSRFYRYLAWTVISVFFKTSKEGAQTCIHLCLSPELENISGHYFADCKFAEISAEAKSDILVERVWEKSVLLTRDYITPSNLN